MLIVLDGGDGSGKTTQTKMLMDYFKKNNLSVMYVDFPQYDSSFYGKMVAQFLRGEFGGINNVSPYLASLLYALDRDSIKHKMITFLEKGGYIVANRYASSNMAHQGSKFSDSDEKEKFLRWVKELEYTVHKIPKEDVVIYLYVPWQIGQTLTSKKGNRKYLQGKKRDIHETDQNHLAATEKMYLSLSGSEKHWAKIDCTQNGQLLSPQKIHERIIEVLKKRKIITV